VGDVVKALLAAPINAVLLVAGLAFLAVAVFRRVTDRLDAGPKGRLFAGALGITLIGLSLYLSASPGTTRNITFGDAAKQSDVPSTQSNGSLPITLPAGQVVKGEDRTYTILKLELDRYQIDQLSLTVTVRLLNQGNYPTNFWNANFRLLVDGLPREPTNMLDEVVAANAATEGTVVFAFPANAKSVALQVDKFGPDAPGLHIALPSQP
jgi:hypothetical protein